MYAQILALVAKAPHPQSIGLNGQLSSAELCDTDNFRRREYHHQVVRALTSAAALAPSGVGTRRTGISNTEGTEKTP